MKKLIMMLMAFCLITPMAYAELTRKQEKKVVRMAKERSRELAKEGYAVMGGMPLRDALETHLRTVENGALEQTGTGRSKSKSMCRQMCLTYAMAEYASKASSQLKGRIVTDGHGNETDTDSDIEFSRFYAAYERLTQKEIKGEMQESFTVSRQSPDGRYDFLMYFTIDPKKAAAAREKAVRDAVDESGLGKEHADRILQTLN